MARIPRRIVLAVAAGSLVVSAGLRAPAGAAPRPLAVKKTNPITLAPGVTYTRYTDTSVPLRYYVVEIELDKASSVDVGMAGSTFGNYARTSTIGGNAGAVAAINGDFSDNGMPVHPFGEDGILKTSGPNVGASFAVLHRAGDTAEIDAKLNSAKANIDGLNKAISESFAVGRWNEGPPGSGAIAGYTPVGGSVQRPPKDACSVRLEPSGGYTWGAGQAVTRSFRVDIVRCQSEAMALSGGYVLAADRGRPVANTIQNMSNGDVVDLSWTLENWAGVLDAIGGAPLLLHDGNVKTDDNCGGYYFCDRNPRSGIGIKQNGNVLLVTVDGRSSRSRGVTLVGFANLFKSLNADHALNLDGGGGATMWIKGKGVVNNPSDGSERPITNVMMVLPGGDKGQPSPALSPASSVSPANAADAEQAAVEDPASSGGLADYLVGTARLRGGSASRGLLDLARAFRAA